MIRKILFFRHLFLAFLLACFPSVLVKAQDSSKVINDISQLNPIIVNKLVFPTTVSEISKTIKTHEGPISIGGARYSMGGQIATEKALYIDMSHFDSILSFSKTEKTITVQSGITWRKIQEFIDPHNLSMKIMQTYANFTVGGSLSVNVHGRYLGEGPIILSVKEIKLVLANGEQITASSNENKELFYGAIGGYGGLGVITEATLYLTDNVKLERTDKVFSIKNYAQFFLDSIISDTTVIFHNADIYPKRYKKIRVISFRETTKEVTVQDRLIPKDKNYRFKRFAFKIISKRITGKFLRQHLIDPILFKKNPVVWRNYEASYDVKELEPKSRKKSTYILQEYFVPVEYFDSFYPKLTHILKDNKVNVLNISIRHAKQDPGSTLAWAKKDVFTFVIYYKQGTKEKHRTKVKKWTNELIEANLSCNGTFYLPYQIHATQEQFFEAYPNAKLFFELKKHYDPSNKFRNKLWDKYYVNQNF